MEYEKLKTKNRTKMAVSACLGGFFGLHNFMLSNSVSGSIKIYLTLVALVSPHHVSLCLIAVDLAWILFDLWQICFLATLPEIRFVGSRKKAVLFVIVYIILVTSLACFLFY